MNYGLGLVAFGFPGLKLSFVQHFFTCGFLSQQYFVGNGDYFHYT